MTCGVIRTSVSSHTCIRNEAIQAKGITSPGHGYNQDKHLLRKIQFHKTK